MRRALATTTAAIVLTALVVSTAGCGGFAAAAAPPAMHPPASDRPAAITAAAAKAAGARAAGIYEQVLRRYLTTPGENSFPRDTFTTVYVLNRAYPDAAVPDGTHRRGVPIPPPVRRQVIAALAGIAHIIFVVGRRSVLKDGGGCAQVRNGGILITLGPPAGHGDDVHVAISGFAACLGATWLTYVLRDQPGAGWRVTGTTGGMAIS